MNNAVSLALNDGKTVGVIARSRVDARAMFDRCVYEGGHEASVIHRANGREQIRFPNGGRLIFLTTGPGGRGYSFDRVFVDSPDTMTASFMENIAPTMNTSTNPGVDVFAALPSTDKEDAENG